jgi:hypothetical protein
MNAHLDRNDPDAARQHLGPLVAEHEAGLEPKVRVIACGGLTALLPAGAAWAAFSNISGMGWVALALAMLTPLAAVGLVVLVGRLKWRALLHRDGLILEGCSSNG